MVRQSVVIRQFVGVYLPGETGFEVERNVLPSEEFYPAGVEIGREERRWFPAFVGFREALTAGFPLWNPVLLLRVLRAKAHNFFTDPLVRVERVHGFVTSGVV